MRLRRGMLTPLFIFLFTMPLFAQSKQTQVLKVATEASVEQAALALALAESAGAPLYAKELYDEAFRRLTFARASYENKERREREQARLAGMEAYHAARASEAKSRWVTAANEARNLTEDIGRFGGEISTAKFDFENMMAIERGVTSRDRVKYAEQILQRARNAGGDTVARADLSRAEANLVTARRIAKEHKQSESADHLAYVAEMLARRSEYLVRRAEVDRMLPALRLERTRLARAQSEARAAEEIRLRQAAERQAIELRTQLADEARARKMQEEELARLRQQVMANERLLIERLQEDRTARIDAERRLDQLIANYESALGSSRDPNEVDALRRQVEDQQIALRSLQDQERMTEQARVAEIERLKVELDNEKQGGRSTSEVLRAREDELRRQREELDAARQQREQADQRRVEVERSLQNAVAEADKRRAEAEAESARLRDEVESARARTAQTEAELTQARGELSRRDTAERDRMTRMEEALAKVAVTRRDTRGFIVTLPGIFFDSGKSTLKTGARNVLNKIARELSGVEGAKISIEGHTDSQGSEELNQRLSEKRATAVHDYLVARGVAHGRVTMSGLGETAPVASNDTASGRQQNRRVELIITE